MFYCRFMCSADEFITTAHVPSHKMKQDGEIEKEIEHEERMVWWYSEWFGLYLVNFKFKPQEILFIDVN